MTGDLKKLFRRFERTLSRRGSGTFADMVYSLSKKCSDGQAARLALAFLNTHGGSGAAIHNAALRQVPHYPVSGLRPQQRKLADLLPISPVPADFFRKVLPPKWMSPSNSCI